MDGYLWHDLGVPFALWGLAHAVGVVVTYNYRYFLTRQLGKAGHKAYLANGYIRVIATFITFEYVAFATLILVYM